MQKPLQFKVIKKEFEEKTKRESERCKNQYGLK